MRLPDGPRQIVAALAASGVFLAIYFGLKLEWYVALALAAVVYAALYLVIGRRTPLSEIVLSDRVTAADVRAGHDALTDAMQRLAKAAGSTADLRAALEDMGLHLASIRQQIVEDPADFRAARRFIVSYLPRLVANVESYASLAAKASGSAVDRLTPLREGILAYAPVIARIDQAGLENDFLALESEIDALAFQLKRG